MKRAAKAWLIAAACLVAAGAALFAAALLAGGGDLADLSTETFETNTHGITAPFSSISVETNTADVTFLRSEDGLCRVECYESGKERHTVSVEGDTLVIRATDGREPMDHMGIRFESPAITVYLPGESYAALLLRESTGAVTVPDSFAFGSVDIKASTGDIRFAAAVSGLLQIETSTGDIRVESAAVGAIDLSASTGDITVSGTVCGGDAALRVTTGRTELNGVTCRDLTSKGSTGDLFLTDTAAAGTLSVTRSTGDVCFDGADGAEIRVETDTGDVTGALRSQKVFLVETDTGDVDVPESVTGGLCEIITDTGNIRITAG